MIIRQTIINTMFLFSVFVAGYILSGCIDAKDGVSTVFNISGIQQKFAANIGTTYQLIQPQQGAEKL